MSISILPNSSSSCICFTVMIVWILQPLEGFGVQYMEQDPRQQLFCYLWRGIGQVLAASNLELIQGGSLRGARLTQTA